MSAVGNMSGSAMTISPNRFVQLEDTENGYTYLAFSRALFVNRHAASRT